MKTFKSFAALVLVAFATMSATVDAGYFDVYLKNNCGKEVEVRVRADGSSSTSKYKSGEKTKVPVKAGYEVYVDGKLLQKFADSDSGKEINLCK
ncbi:hypothetical protein [Flavobacterium sp.]|uniref:hypothetical protein n=1 Tax=Flavobacterium sp. TaxID=239 RepID=UPI0011FDBBD9|nr:hypothetical protein [Flavobacterium sp.]RZJ73603.1 MAG: hypothetical protein EOO49_01990 [Flavobacterium sp.]